MTAQVPQQGQGSAKQVPRWWAGKNGHLSSIGRALFGRLKSGWLARTCMQGGSTALGITSSMISMLVKEMCSVCENQFRYTLFISALFSLYILFQFKRFKNSLKYFQPLCVQQEELQRSQLLEDEETQNLAGKHIWRGHSHKAWEALLPWWLRGDQERCRSPEFCCGGSWNLKLRLEGQVAALSMTTECMLGVGEG